MTIHLQFITPCFCAGANQLVAEIRASAIRGELRWWFRCLGGTKAQECEVFGTEAGRGSSSSVMVRVSNVARGKDDYSPSFISPNDPQAYHHYFLQAPNNKGESRMWATQPDPTTKKKGTIRRESQLPMETEFDLTLNIIRSISDEKTKALYLSAVECMVNFGSLGYRKSRGFGAWTSMNDLQSLADLKKLLESIEPAGFSWEFEENGNKDPLSILRQIEGLLKGDKEKKTGHRLNHKAVDRTPLGYSRGEQDRQSSAVYFRPCAYKTKAGDVQYSLLTFQAPDSVLGDAVKSEYKGKTRLISP
jgi:CRISPR-associated protein Cmr1